VTLINQSHLDELKQKGVLYLPHAAINADWLDNLALLGAIMQRGISGVQQIKPIENSDKRSFSLSFDALNPHTEGPYLNHPPRYLVLHGIHPASCGGGLTSFCDGYALFKHLPIHLQDLAAKDYAFPVMDREGNTVADGIKAPILENRHGLSPILRYSENLLRYGRYCLDGHKQLTGDLLATELADRVATYYRQTATTLRIAQGDILILDNHRILHARTAFQDKERLLEAVWLKE
jgi:alpha-ketoglutarate-dependent taurine dioxygenase